MNHSQFGLKEINSSIQVSFMIRVLLVLNSHTCTYAWVPSTVGLQRTQRVQIAESIFEENQQR